MPREPITREDVIKTIEDQMRVLSDSNSRGMATGLCGAFYMCGLLSTEEWEEYLKRIPTEMTCAEQRGKLRSILQRIQDGQEMTPAFCREIDGILEEVPA